MHNTEDQGEPQDIAVQMCSNHKKEDSIMTQPLVSIGPGGDYVSHYVPQGARLIRTSGSDNQHESSQGSAGYSRTKRQKAKPQTLAAPSIAAGPQDVYEHTPLAPQAGQYQPNSADPTHGVKAPGDAIFTAISSWLHAQRQAITQLHSTLLPTTAPTDEAHQRAVNKVMRDLQDIGVIASPPSIDCTSENDHESVQQTDTQTAHNSQTHPRSSDRTRLFPDDERIVRRIGRQQSHHIRARRSTHQKRSLAAAGQQGTLFGS
jgi:hypothetical protein